MKFSPEQDAALKAVAAWLKTGSPQIFRLFGFAGTGKTTLARHIAEGIDGTVLFAAFTGKAAQVLRAKGCKDARTLHSLIYRPRGEAADEGTGEMSPTFALNRGSPVAKAALVIVDECSMVDEALGRDLLSFGAPILVLGDPGQLPPVQGGGFFTEAPADALLTEVHRQARENPIIAMAQTIREGGRLAPGNYGESRVIDRRAINAADVLAADQVLLGVNRTRRLYNGRIRELKGFSDPLPQADDKLVCLRNNSEKGLLNGGLWRVRQAAPWRRDVLTLLLRSEDEEPASYAKVRVLRQAFAPEGEPPPWEKLRNVDQFDYGYALTVHKAQGSQWDRIVLFDESFAFKEYRERWLYTAITRAAERLTIVR